MRYEHAVNRGLESTSFNAVVNVGHMIKRIGILVFERFPLSDVCLLADAFRLANEAQADQDKNEGAPAHLDNHPEPVTFRVKRPVLIGGSRTHRGEDGFEITQPHAEEGGVGGDSYGILLDQ